MKKSIFSCVISFILILSLSFSAFAAEITAEFSGLQGMFSNGYFGFCIDLDLKGATAGGGFTAAESTEVATNNVDGRDISQTLKIFFVTCFNDLFTVEENGECKINTSKAGTSVQGVIYNYSDNQSGQIWGAERKGYVEKIESYNGPAIPDEGHTITLDNGKIVTFYFMVIEPETEGVQSFFAVKAVASDAPAHVHNPAEKWESDDDNHWHECDCGEKFDEDAHKGTTADCKNPSVCEVCGKELGGTDSENHTGNTEIRNDKPATEFEDGYTGDKHCSDCGVLLEEGEVIPATHKHNPAEKWESDDDNHWHECDCGEKFDEDVHKGTTADCKNPSVCEVCGKELGGVDSENHTGNTEIRNDKPATEFEDGYTGDKHCSDCGELLEKGEVIPATHKHNPAEKWESDDDNHWHECDCGEKFDEDSHKGTTADCKNPSVCEVCGKELSGADSENHTGNTEIRNDKPVKELEDGYTGDKHCADCGELLEKGKIIPATHKHNPDKKWESDKDNHWHECICGEKSDKASHTFADGKCSVCGFEAEVKDDTPADKEENADGNDADDNTTGDNAAGSDSNDGSDASIPETDSTDSDPDLIPDTDADSDKTDSEPETEITEEKPESEVADDKYESEIPNTGSDSLVFAVMFANLFAAILFFTCFKKKKTSKSES